jgi:alpha-L-fucosidase
MTDFSRRAVIASGLVASAAPAFAQKGAGAPAPYGAIPSARQWRWHQREQYAFIHFAMNTFTDKEWGYGDEDPKMFNPSDFSADQIVAAAKAGNLKGIILTAKHHDGFCLWPTKLTEHCIRNSPYKNGQGDIVREMSDACKRAGLAFGIYLSPWDRNRADYGRPSYVDYFRKQVVELCTGYGELFEFWFDGANGGDGYYGGARETRQIDAPKYYNWPSIIALVHQYQPMACTFDPLGADIRWVGNEDGIAGDPCWPTMPNHPYVQSEGNSGVRGAPLWWPAETNTSIRPGWFYHADEDSKVRSPENLVGYFDTSVARGTNMNLNLPPDRRGRIPDQDVKILKSFGDAIRASFATDLAQGSVASASHVRGKGYEAARVLDGQRDTYWSAPDGVTTPSLTLDLPPNRSFDLIRIREYLPLGVRVTRFAVDAEVNGTWQQLAEHECISAQRIIRLPQPITLRSARRSARSRCSRALRRSPFPPSFRAIPRCWRQPIGKSSRPPRRAPKSCSTMTPRPYGCSPHRCRVSPPASPSIWGRSATSPASA